MPLAIRVRGVRPRMLYLGRGAGIASVLKATHCHNPNFPLHSYLLPADASLSLLLILSICGPIRIRSLGRGLSARVLQIDSWTETNLPPRRRHRRRRRRHHDAALVFPRREVDRGEGVSSAVPFIFFARLDICFVSR